MGFAHEREPDKKTFELPKVPGGGEEGCESLKEPRGRRPSRPPSNDGRIAPRFPSS